MTSLNQLRVPAGALGDSSDRSPSHLSRSIGLLDRRRAESLLAIHAGADDQGRSATRAFLGNLNDLPNLGMAS